MADFQKWKVAILLPAYIALVQKHRYILCLVSGFQYSLTHKAQDQQDLTVGTIWQDIQWKKKYSQEFGAKKTAF